jgi:regulator of protease activity HflC (stomatin/prohibitin superfamily)
VVVGSCAVTAVETGHVGVTTLFGRVTGERLDEGIHLLNPMKRVAQLSVRTQQAREVAEVPSSEGLLVHLEASLLFRLDARRANDVFQKIGPDYQEVIVSLNSRSVMRDVTAAHTASALYSEGRETGQMLTHLRKALEPS